MTYPFQSTLPVPVKQRRGFAVVVALTLMGFLTLLLVSLSVLVRVETSSAKQFEHEQTARAHAMLGVSVALGQLQKYAGPDQRVSAQAEINSANASHPNWTGIWDATPADPSDPSHALPPADDEPLAWLVSGNEINGKAITPDQALPDPAAYNGVVWMVQTAGGAAVPADKQVKVRVVPTQGAAAEPGAYAYWVGDVGSEIPLTLTNPFPNPPPGSLAQREQLNSAPAPGIELVLALEPIWHKLKPMGN